jgi:ribosomal protein L37E
VLQRRRAFDVCEQECNRAGWGRAHALRVYGPTLARMSASYTVTSRSTVPRLAA